MTNSRHTAQRTEKSLRRTKSYSASPFKAPHVRSPNSRGTSAPARLSVNHVDRAERRRGVSPCPALAKRSSSQGYHVRKSRSPRPQFQPSMEMLSLIKKASEELSAEFKAKMAVKEEAHVLDQLCELLLQHGSGPKRANDFANSNLEPPVTRHSLSELDISSIMTNSKLRHDINFDRELHFRPNLDGAKGKVKKRAQEDYWSALMAELELYHLLARNPTHPCLTFPLEQLKAASKRRIPPMFETVKDILKSLVPEQEQHDIDNYLDVKIIMQEIDRGVCDLSKMARCLSHILKAHCAPMRDPMIDRMVQCIDKGTEDGQPHLLVEGLVQLFGVMEAMKLDVANHQIRHLRLILIEGTISFEQNNQCNKIANGRLSPKPSRAWYKSQQAYTGPSPNKLDATTKLSVFVNAFVNLLLCPFSPEPFPETFTLDSDRLRTLRSEINDMFCLDACEKVYVDLAATAGLRSAVSYSSRKALRSAMSSILNHAPYGASWDDNLEHITLELVRQVLLLRGEGAETLPSERQEHLRERAEDVLRSLFFDPKRSFFWGRGVQLKDEILAPIAKNVQRFLNASPVDIFNAFIPASDAATRQKNALGRANFETQSPENLVRDIVRRASHIAVLHWRVWAPLVYLHEPDGADEASKTVNRTDIPIMGQQRLEVMVRDSPASSQQLSTASEGSWGEAKDVAERTDTLNGAAISATTAGTSSDGTTAPPSAVDEMVAGQQMLPDDPPSPVMCQKQRTN